jgi:predicted nucleic acid-binding protein
MIVVADTSPLNYLILTESVHVLPMIFGGVRTTTAVINELLHPKSPEAVRTWASTPPKWLTVQDPARIDASLKLGVGETSAISLAIEINAHQVLIDERKGYKAAIQRGLNATTTLGLLEEASHRGLIDFEKTLNRLDKETTFYVTEDVLEEFRRRVREQQQADDWKRQEQRTRDQGDAER